MISQNGIPFIVGKPCGNKLHYFDLELAKATNEVMNMAITTASCDYTLWHQRMGHAHQCMINNLADNTEDSPDTIKRITSQTCKGYKKGKSKWLHLME